MRFPISDDSAPMLPEPEPQQALPSPDVRREIGDFGRTRIEHYQDAVEKAFTRQERDFRQMMKDLFEIQEKETLKNLRVSELVTSGVNGNSEVSAVMKQGGEPIFQPTDWLQLFDRRGRPLILAAMSQAARAQSRTFRIPPWNPDNPNVKLWLDERTRFWADRVNDETARLLRQEIQAGVANGESIRALQDRVEKVFRFNDVVRSERIARTEVIAASNRGHLELYRQSGVVAKKRWLTARDERVRPEHQAANGQTVDVDEKFVVGGYQMDAPGLGGPASMTVNCRCVATPVVER